MRSDFRVQCAGSLTKTTATAASELMFVLLHVCSSQNSMEEEGLVSE